MALSTTNDPWEAEDVSGTCAQCGGLTAGTYRCVACTKAATATAITSERARSESSEATSASIGKWLLNPQKQLIQHLARVAFVERPSRGATWALAIVIGSSLVPLGLFVLLATR